MRFIKLVKPKSRLARNEKEKWRMWGRHRFSGRGDL